MNRTVASGRQTGLTLIELLIVVIILGILAAAVVPLFGEQTVKARVATLKGDLATLRTQFALYQAEHDGLPPGVARQSGATTVRVVDGAAALQETFDLAAFRAGTAVTIASKDNSARVIEATNNYGNILEQLLGTTDRNGLAGTNTTRTYGPYLQKIPNNQFATNGVGARFRIIHPLPANSTIAAATDPTTGCDFYYTPYTLEIKATGTVSPMPPNEVEQGHNTLQDL